MGLDERLRTAGAAILQGLVLCGRSSGAEPGKAAKVVAGIRHADLHLRAGRADGTDEERHAVLLSRKGMLDAGADSRTRGIGLGLLLGEPAPGRLAELKPLRQATLGLVR